MKLDFQFETAYGKFADALVFSDDAVPSEAEIERMKQDRLNGWLALVTPQPELSQPEGE